MSALFFGLSLIFLLSLVLVVVSRYVRMAVAWGMLVGPFLGVWVIAPLWLVRHHLTPAGLFAWGVVGSFLLAAFAFLGAIFAFLTSVPLALYEFLSRRGFRSAAIATLGWVLIAVPSGYFMLSAFIEWTFFSRHAAPDFGGGVVVSAVLIAAVSGSLVVGVYSSIGRWKRHVSAASVAAALVIFVLAGSVLLVWRTARVARRLRASAVVVHPLTARASGRHVPPLLVVGLDGGNWQTLQPLIDQGRVPTLARLVAQGIRGDMHAEWPPYWSTPAWGAIVTGHSEDEIGVHEDASAIVPGLAPIELPLTLTPALNPMLLLEFVVVRSGAVETSLAPRVQISLPPIWERLSNAGVRTAVVAFPFTYPARDQAAYVVSNRVVTDTWQMLGVRPGKRGDVVGPPSKASELQQLFDVRPPDASANTSAVEPLPQWPQPADLLVDPSAIVRQVMDTSERMFNLTTHLVRADLSLGAVMLYTSDFDSVSHALWQYRFPGEYADNPPAPKDVAVLGPILDRHLEYLDRQIAQVIAAFPEPPNIIVVSDHGEEASPLVTPWRALHGPKGIFLAAGPDFVHQEGLPTVSYYDVAPTILDLLDFQAAADMRGHSLVSSPDTVTRAPVR